MAERLCSPLLLQDMVMVRILLQLEDFSIQSLALLSHTVRQNIFRGMTKADLLHFRDAGSPEEFPVMFCRVQARTDLLSAIFAENSAGRVLSLNFKECLGKPYADSCVPLHAHICECYSSLEPTCVNEYLFPKRSLEFVHPRYAIRWISTYDLDFRYIALQRLLDYCNLQRAPTKLSVDVCSFGSSVFWLEFNKYMTDMKGAQVSSKLNPNINLVIPIIQELFSNVEVLELRCLTRLNISTKLYVILYNILTSRQPSLKHLEVHGIPDTIQQVMSTVVELLHATCTTPSKSIFHQYTGLEPLSLPTTPYILEGISVLSSRSKFSIIENTPTFFVSSISRDMMSVLQLHMHKLKSVVVNGLGYCCDADRATFGKGFILDGMSNINVPEYRAFLMLLVEFIKQPQFTNLNVDNSPLPEGFELILAFLCTPASHEQSLTIEARSKRSVEEAKDDNEDKENWIVNQDTNEEGKCPKKFKFALPMKPPCFPSEPLPLTNAQYKCLDLGQSSVCVYSWLFDQLPELKLKSLKMRTLDMCIVPADMMVQVEHVAFTLTCSLKYFVKPAISTAHLEKFVFSNPALKRLEFINATAASLLPMLNHCLQELGQQGRGLEELILTRFQLDKVVDTQLKELFIRLRDCSHRYGTTFVFQPDFSFENNASKFFMDLSKEFGEKKVKKIVCSLVDWNNMVHSLEKITEVLVLNYDS